MNKRVSESLIWRVFINNWISESAVWLCVVLTNKRISEYFHKLQDLRTSNLVHVFLAVVSLLIKHVNSNRYNNNGWFKELLTKDGWTCGSCYSCMVYFRLQA